MQSRPYPEKNGVRIWLSRSEQRRLLEAVEDEPRRRIALELALHGLRSDEIVQTKDGGDVVPGVQPRHFRELSNGADGHVLIVPDGKTGKRETPVSEGLVDRVMMLKNAARLRKDEEIVDVTTRSLRDWIDEAREVLLDVDDAADSLGMHDLRRSWATDTYYSLALAGVPIAEQLTMSWGGWKQTSTGRETFRQNYLGPVPDHVVSDTIEFLPLE